MRGSEIMGDLVSTPNAYSNAWPEVPIGERDDNLQRAIAAHEAALTVYTKDSHPLEWAKTQTHLGHAWRELPTGDKRENIRRAIAAYQAALTIYTRDAQPSEWAGAQNKLGEAWQELAATPAVRSQTIPGIVQLSPQVKANGEAYENALNRYSSVYPGEMLAVVGDRLIEHGVPADAVIDRSYLQADREGIPRENVVFVPLPTEEAFR
jgi:hypothetical protein